MTNQAKDNSFIRGTAILAVSGMAVKLLSAAYRIPLTRMIGAEGMGRYSAAFNIFMPFFSLATAGITPAVSRMTATRQLDELVSIKHTATKCFGTASLILMAFALAVSWFYSGYMDQSMIFYGVCLLVPNLFFATFEAIYKGISQGALNMSVTAKASLLESTAKLIIGITTVYLAGVMVQERAGDAQLICAFATVSICGFICWWYMHRDFKKRYLSVDTTSRKVNRDNLLSMAVPIALSALVVSLANFSDTVISLPLIQQIPDSQLMAAYPFVSFSAEDEKAIWLFGVYQGLCLSVTNLIPSLSAAMGSSGLPFLTRSIQADKKAEAHTHTVKLISITALLVVPVSLFVSFFPEEVLVTLYGDRGAQTTLAAYFLRFMAPVAILSAFSFPFNSILHAQQKSATILKILLFACGVKVIGCTYLCSQPGINIMGCVISQMIFHTLVFVLSLITIIKSGAQLHIFRRLAVPVAVSYILLTFLRILSDFVLYTVPTVFRTFFIGGIFVVGYVAVFLFIGFSVDK